MILQLRHTSLISQSLEEIHSGRETGLIDTSSLKFAIARKEMRLVREVLYIMNAYEMVYDPWKST